MEITEREIQYSSSVTKMLHHSDRMKWPIKPLTLQLVPTDKCNLKCVFCSVANRPQNELDIDTIKGVLDHHVFYNLKGVEITGGGDPTMYKDIAQLVKYLHNNRLAIGLITNGIRLKKVLGDRIGMMKWVRVSLNSLDYVEDIDLPEFPPETTLGFSYVLSSLSTQDRINKVSEYARRHNAAYVRIVPNCLDLSKDYPGLDLSDEKFYVQTKAFKSLTPVAPCRMGYLKPYLYTDKYFYWCSGVCLEERRFPEMYRMGSVDEIDIIWAEQKPLDCHFSKCFWVEHNILLEQVNSEVMHEEFV